ncbi:hypothetical protein [Microcoleus sp. herbarium14]|uniref:hypothetical protein n=1 Tax=Microcoleus sp. herbarium14 TaxID=3055439 RepID=UPI002FD72921
MKIFTPAAIIILVVLIEFYFDITNGNNIGLKLYILCGYIVLGGSSKYIDEAYDESIFDKKIALFLAAISMFLLVSLVLIDYISGIIFIAVAVGLLAAGKIDNLIFRLLTVSILISALLRLLFYPFAIDFSSLSSWLFVFIIIALASFVDEWLNDFSDRNKKSLHFVLKVIFHNRLVTKITILLFCVLGHKPNLYFYAFLGFDAAYSLIDNLADKVKQKILRAKQNALYLPR